MHICMCTSHIHIHVFRIVQVCSNETGALFFVLLFAFFFLCVFWVLFFLMDLLGLAEAMPALGRWLQQSGGSNRVQP